MSNKQKDKSSLEQNSEKIAQEKVPEQQSVPDAAQFAKEQAEQMEALTNHVEQLQKELQNTQDQQLRLAAEYDNFRKRTQKERESTYCQAQADTVEKLLPVYDNLQRALLQPTEDTAYQKGVELIMSQLKEVFEKMGVNEIPALNEPFNPGFHNAVMHAEDESVGDNIVIEVFQNGFMLGNRVIRVAMVKVAN